MPAAASVTSCCHCMSLLRQNGKELTGISGMATKLWLDGPHSTQGLPLVVP